MKHRIFPLLLSLALLFSLSAQAAADSTPLFPRSQVYESQFADVDTEGWYYPYAVAGYEYGLFTGRDSGFAPNEPIHVSELLTLSARIHAVYAGDEIRPQVAGELWYTPYVEYLNDRGLLPDGIADYDAEATRAQLAGIFARSLPETCYDDRNGTLISTAYASGAFIHDVDESTSFKGDILWLYQQGLLAGTDETGSYRPDQNTSRAETAALVTRMVDPSLRITLNWTAPLYRSAAGKTLADLVEAPANAPQAPEIGDAQALDAVLRQMLAKGENTLTLHYPRQLTMSEASDFTYALTTAVKGYCEQMYNVTQCTYEGDTVTFFFSASGCTDEELMQYREDTMAHAIEVHDMLWETGQLTSDMSEYEFALVYFRWLCENCEYDYPGATDNLSLSHIAYNALLNGKAVCDGYTGAYNIFLKLEGIECYALPSIRANHIWTVAVLDGIEYHIDTTWGDQKGEINEKYFGMTEEQSYAEHPW